MNAAATELDDWTVTVVTGLSVTVYVADVDSLLKADHYLLIATHAIEMK